MANKLFDTLSYVQRLTAAGVPQKQAEAEVMILADFLDSQVATKHDIKEMEAKIEGRIKDLEVKLAENRSALLMWIIPILFGQIAVGIAILMKLL